MPRSWRRSRRSLRANEWLRDEIHKLLDMRNVSCGHGFANEYSIDVRAGDGKTLLMYSPSLSADEMKRMKILVRRASETNVCLCVVRRLLVDRD